MSEPLDPGSPPDQRSSSDPRELALRVLAVAALCTCALLFVDYVRPPVFCADHHAGCDTVRNSAWARVAGLPLPVLGTAYYTALLIVASLAARWARRLLALMGAAGVLSGLMFLGVQAFVLHAFCRYCVVVDITAILAGGVALSLWNTVPAPASRLNLLAAGAATMAFLVPFIYGMTRPIPGPPPGPVVEERLPAEIAEVQRPGVVTIVEFVDFECPFCRRQHVALAPIVASFGDRVRVIRHNVPLSFHEHARGAARAAACAEEQRQGEAMSDALFRAEDLTAEGCARIAEDLHLDLATWRACLASPRPDVTLERDHDLARRVGVSGLPTFWIGRERFEGLQDEATVRASIQRALQAPTPRAEPGAARDAQAH